MLMYGVGGRALRQATLHIYDRTLKRLYLLFEYQDPRFQFERLVLTKSDRLCSQARATGWLLRIAFLLI